MTADDLDRFVSVADAAERLDIHHDTAYAMIREDKFPVPVVMIGGRRKVSLRRLVEFINGEAA